MSGAMSLIRIHSPDNEPELITVVAMLEAHDIPCFVHSAGFGGLYPGPQINGYNTRSIWVPEEQLSVALELLRDFQSQPVDVGLHTAPAPSRFASGTFRALLEALIFGWFIPGSRRSAREK